ncbi:MAG TPA: A/G-specific adenine glycosylase [Feifaniaceae bacterium]|nr:A/G-specific adenine glycosylase [Feifaniaceae bacterium]
MEWYRINARDLPWRRTRDPYAIWISEIMLQQTRVAAVIPYYERFMAELPDAFALSRISDDRLHKLWEGLGYYSRARNLKRAAMEITEQYGGKLPGTYKELLKLPGIGEYTAGAIASIAFGEAVPSVDGNVLRVYARLFADARDVRGMAFRKEVRAFFLPLMRVADPALFNAALMELGATVCLPNGAPKCELCPVAEYCEARRQNRTAELPVVGKKSVRRVEQKTVFALTVCGLPLGYRRAEKGLLAGLWQLPDTAGLLTDAEAAVWMGERGILPVGELRFYKRKHVFTHIEWQMRVCSAEVAAGVLPEGWVLLDERHALPTAYRVCL